MTSRGVMQVTRRARASSKMRKQHTQGRAQMGKLLQTNHTPPQGCWPAGTREATEADLHLTSTLITIEDLKVITTRSMKGTLGELGMLQRRRRKGTLASQAEEYPHLDWSGVKLFRTEKSCSNKVGASRHTEARCCVVSCPMEMDPHGKELMSLAHRQGGPEAANSHDFLFQHVG
nr:uncharacterized protein LOC123290052 isoform X4 [Equus asinus]